MSCPYTAHLGSIDFNCEEDVDGIIWMWETLEGWFGAPPVRIAEQDKGPDGEVFTTARHLGRPFILRGSAVIPAAQPDLWFQAVSMLNNAANLVRAPGLFLIDEPIPLQAYVRRNGQVRMDRLGNLESRGILTFEVPLKSQDPRKYSQALTTVSTLQLTASFTGTTQPITNLGTEDTPPTFTIDGPAVNPIVTNNAAATAVQWVGTLGGGDTLVLDFENRQALVNGGDSSAAINPLSVWSYLDVGTTAYSYGRTGGTGTTTAIVTFREAYI